MFTTKNNNAATRISMPVVLTDFQHDPHTGGGAGSLYAFCNDGTKRVCRINRCESIQYARELYATLRSSVGKRLTFSAAGGNDPRTWFFDVKVIEDPVPPVYDDSPDYVFGMKVEEPELETAEEAAMSSLALHEQIQDSEAIVEASVTVTWLLVKLNGYIEKEDTTWNEWMDLRYDLHTQKQILEGYDDFELSNLIDQRMDEIASVLDHMEVIMLDDV